MQNAELDESQAGIKIAGRNINNLRYADDITNDRKWNGTKSFLIKVKKLAWNSTFKKLRSWHRVPSVSVQFSHSVVSNSLRPHELQHARLPCPSPTPGVHSDSHPSGWWCHPAISSSVVPFSSCPQSLPASESFPMSRPFASDGQIIGASASASVLPMYIQDWFPLGLTGLISLLSKGLSRVFSNTTVQKHQFFNSQSSLWSNFHIHTWLLEKW